MDFQDFSMLAKRVNDKNEDAKDAFRSLRLNRRSAQMVGFMYDGVPFNETNGPMGISMMPLAYSVVNGALVHICRNKYPWITGLRSGFSFRALIPVLGSLLMAFATKLNDPAQPPINAKEFPHKGGVQLNTKANVQVSNTF